MAARIELEGLLPILHRLGCPAEFVKSITDMVEDNGIVFLQQLGRAEERFERLRVESLLEIHPTQADELSPIFRFLFDRPADQNLGFIEVFIAVRPHVAEVVVGARRIRRVHLDGFFE